MSMLILAPIIPFTLTRRITIEFHAATHIPLRTTKHLSNLVMDFWEMEIEMRPWPNKSRGCVKSVGVKFGNDQIFDMENFDKVSRRIEWSKNEFSHSLSPEPTAVGRFSSAFAVHVASRRWLSFLR